MSARRALLVTGTDTGIGKTFVTATIAAALSSRGVTLGVAKPAETGCRREGDGLYAEDAETLIAASGRPQPLDRVCPYRFPEPLAPALAAERAGARIDADRLRATLAAAAESVDVLLIEGAGGALVPIVDRFTFADLARELGASALVVVGSRLGALNHALLTFEALAARGVGIAGYVLNRLAPPGDLAVETNAAALAALTDVKAIGELPWVVGAAALLAGLRGPGPERARGELAALGERHLDLDAVLGA